MMGSCTFNVSHYSLIRHVSLPSFLLAFAIFQMESLPCFFGCNARAIICGLRCALGCLVPVTADSWLLAHNGQMIW